MLAREVNIAVEALLEGEALPDGLERLRGDIADDGCAEDFGVEGDQIVRGAQCGFLEPLEALSAGLAASEAGGSHLLGVLGIVRDAEV